MFCGGVFGVNGRDCQGSRWGGEGLLIVVGLDVTASSGGRVDVTTVLFLEPGDCVLCRGEVVGAAVADTFGSAKFLPGGGKRVVGDLLALLRPCVFRGRAG